MINVDTRILTKVTGDEYWLLTHLIKFLGTKESVWPSNKTLCRDTKWNIDKLQKIKKCLIDKGFITVEVKFNTSNVYRFHTKLIKIFIDVDGQELEEKRSTVKSSRVSTVKDGKQSTVKSSNEVLVNEVLVNEDAELFNSAPQKSLFDSIPEQERTEKKQCPFYKKFVDAWMVAYPTLGFNGVSGKKIKELITHTENHLISNRKEVSEEKMLGMFQYVLAYVARVNHFVHRKPITTFEGQYLSIIEEIIHGKSTNQTRKPSTRDIINAIVNS